MKNVIVFLALAAGIAAGAATQAQILPNDADNPVRVVKGRGDFAQKLNGVKMPAGKDWKPVMDTEKRLQILVPRRWKAQASAKDEAIIRATPPGDEKKPEGVLLVLISTPRDTDPLEIDETFALSYADDVAQEPALKQLQFKTTDAGYVIARGMRFALAGGTMVGDKKEVFKQEQLVYIGEDRIVTIQFTAREKDFAKHAADLAGIFASYQTIGVRKLEED
jgi:hypothetical protein